jgi:hypothetical protein
MSRIAPILFALAAVTACKSKQKPEDKPAPTGSGTAVVAPAIDAPAAPAAKVKVPNPPVFGCLGWSPTEKAAACVTGTSGMGVEENYEVVFEGSSEPASKLDAADATLAKLAIEPFPSPAKGIKAGVNDLGGGASLVWTAKETDKGGDNQPPTTKHEIVVTCANKKTAEVVNTEIEGSTPTVTVWSVPDHVVIEVNTHIGREGESSETRTAMVLELATCM